MTGPAHGHDGAAYAAEGTGVPRQDSISAETMGAPPQTTPGAASLGQKYLSAAPRIGSSEARHEALCGVGFRLICDSAVHLMRYSFASLGSPVTEEAR